MTALQSPPHSIGRLTASAPTPQHLKSSRASTAPRQQTALLRGTRSLGSARSHGGTRSSRSTWGSGGAACRQRSAAGGAGSVTRLAVRVALRAGLDHRVNAGRSKTHVVSPSVRLYVTSEKGAPHLARRLSLFAGYSRKASIRISGPTASYACWGTRSCQVELPSMRFTSSSTSP